MIIYKYKSLLISYRTSCPDLIESISNWGIPTEMLRIKIKQYIQSISHNQEVNHSICQSVSPSINLSINQSVHQSICQSTSQSINQSVNQPFNQSFHQSINQTISQPITPKLKESFLWSMNHEL